MEDVSFWQNLQSKVFQHPLLSTAFLIGIVILLYGLMHIIPKQQPEEITFEPGVKGQGAEVQEGKELTKDSEIVVDVSGAVAKPGVYSLPRDARVKDALEKAGGVREDADTDRIARELNLAQKLSDGGKLYIPFFGETTSFLGTGSVTGATTSMVNINTATLSQLDTLPKVGAVTAQKIIANRPYSDIKDLLNKKVVGNAVYDAIQTMITAN